MTELAEKAFIAATIKVTPSRMKQNMIEIRRRMEDAELNGASRVEKSSL